jgi:nucleoside-diphosphate-sugar epimerase
VPDIGEGLAVLGEHPSAAGAAWHLPNDPVTRTTREMAELAYRAAGSRARLREIPPLLIRLAAIPNPTLRELLEMRYQFEEPFVVDSTRMTTRLGAKATPAEQAIEETLATYRDRERSPR